MTSLYNYSSDMRKITLALLLITSHIFSVDVSSAAAECVSVNTAAVADDGATVTISSIQIVEKTGSNQLTISYQLQNATPDKKIDEGSFKLFFSNSPATPQYGGFGYLFPSDVKTRSYTWEYLKSQTPTVIEYNADFFAAKPTVSKLHWSASGGSCDLGIVVTPTPTPKASAPTPVVSQTPAPITQVSKAVSKVGYDRDLLKKEITTLIMSYSKYAPLLQPLMDKLALADNVTETDASDKAAIVTSVTANLNSLVQKFSIGKKTTITCVKGKTKKKVVGVKPKCPSGFKLSS